ncbi:hypothetical protein Gpo141_00000778 [Globisporangium polare]
MVGDGFSTWVELPVKISVVVHGMRMPQTRHEESLVTRAWNSKMALLSESATMLNIAVRFNRVSSEPSADEQRVQLPRVPPVLGQHDEGEVASY